MNKEEIFEKNYMPFAIKWGKFSCIIAMLIIYFPALALIIFFDARPDTGAIITGIIGIVSAYSAWYFVDPITLFPILGIPGMYMTYISGNSKEIRGPSALQAMDAAEVKPGTPEGTVISAIGISISILISLAVMTIVAIVGNFMLQILPTAIIISLKYLLPSLFGALAMQRVVLNPKVASIGVPLAFLTFFLKKMGIFKFLPLGGGYTPLMICVFGCMFLSKAIFLKQHPEYRKNKN
ncbi:hypothetical protein LIY46_06335 [Fusobacterium varium]|uniref:hypothetical protein n=1 Tax=Fusobacterium TaxID=848 RepID=UPI0015A34EC5